MSKDEIFDCIIVGGGPAGLSAAIYMGRFMRKTLVLDAGEGRSTFGQVNENYLGFPDGVKITELRELGIRQARRFGVRFEDCFVERLEQDVIEEAARRGKDFIAHTSNGRFLGRTVILCTGVTDHWPDFPGAIDHVGKTLFWCITCDGFRTLDKNVVLFGENDEAATTACQFQLYTKKISFVTARGKLDCSSQKVQALEDHGIEMIEGQPVQIEGTPDKVEAVILDDGRRLPCDIMFSLLGCKPNTKLARDLGLQTGPEGYILVDEEGYTSVPGVFAAGDVSRMHTHQVVSAASEGGEAAQTANYYLYADYQRG
jgi:thioredoxin reductase (NADPH)